MILVGTKGAGKSTFIDRFFRYVLPKSLVEDCIVARVNLADSEGNEANITLWLDRHLLETLEQVVFAGEPPTFNALEGLFWDEYKRRMEGSLKPLYESDKTAFQIEFGKHIERVREDRPHEYIQRLVNHIVKSRKKVPCLIFDNADHFTIEFQEKVFQYARSIYESDVCLVIMPITDRTSWQISREGALRSFESESLFLPTPEPEKVLRKRIEFLEDKLAKETKESGTGYFINRGIRLSIENLTAFTASLQTIFLNTGQVSTWIGNLANNDVRRCLEVAKSLITSPHIEVAELITTYSAGSSIRVSPHKIKRALFRGQYDIYPAGVNSFVHNIFSLSDEFDTSPLMGIRLLLLLKDAQSDRAQDNFVTIEQITEYCRAMAIEPNAVMAWLGKMLEMGLCLSYDPTILRIADVRRLELSPSGEQHLDWGIQDTTYIRTMMEVTPISDSTTLQTLQALGERFVREVWHQELSTFIEYLLGEDANYCKIPDHASYYSQQQLVLNLQSTVVASRPTD